MKKIINSKRKREDDAKQVEKASCQKFLEFYNKQLGKNIKFIKFGNPNLGKGEPDCICSDGLNIEVAIAYYDNIDAENSWHTIDLLKNRINKNDYKKKYKNNTLCMENPDSGLYDSINNIVTNKNKKEYTYVVKLFLLIPSRPAITDEKDMEAYLKRYRNFENKIFDEVWFLLYDNYYSIFQLAKLGDKFELKNNVKVKFKRIKK